MTVSARLINLAGTLLVVIALAIGTILTALPVYFESRALNAQEQEVASSNQLIQARIDALSAKEAELPQVEQELADLHGQLPRDPHLDDVTQLALRATNRVKGSIESIEFGEVLPFAVRDPLSIVDQLPQTAIGVAVAAPDGAVVESGSPPPDTGAADDTATDSGDAPAPAPDAATADQLQWSTTISVNLPDQAAANRFLDELRAGPRLLQIETVNGSLGEESTFSLTVTGLVFVRPGT